MQGCCHSWVPDWCGEVSEEKIHLPLCCCLALYGPTRIYISSFANTDPLYEMGQIWLGLGIGIDVRQCFDLPLICPSPSVVSIQSVPITSKTLVMAGLWALLVAGSIPGLAGGRQPSTDQPRGCRNGVPHGMLGVCHYTAQIRLGSKPDWAVNQPCSQVSCKLAPRVSVSWYYLCRETSTLDQ